MSKTIREWQAHLYSTGKKQGFYDDDAPLTEEGIAAKIALLHSEASEALEVLRDVGVEGLTKRWYRESDGKPEGWGPELADIKIRLSNLATMTGIDLEEEVEIKDAHNATRSHRHGGKKL